MDKGQKRACRVSEHFSRQANLSQAAPGSLCSVQLGKKSCVLTAQKRQIPQDLTGFPNAPISCMADNKDDLQGEADSESADRQRQNCIRHCMQPLQPGEEFC